MIHRQGADEVGGHRPVAQTYHQGGAAVRKQGAQGLCHHPRRPLKGVLLPAEQAVQLNGDIGALGLAQGLGPLPAGDGHCGDGKAVPLLLLGADPRERGGVPRPLPPELVGLHGQICAALGHKTTSFHTRCCGCVSRSPLFFAGRKNPMRKTKKVLQFYPFHVRIHICDGKPQPEIKKIGGGVWFAQY